MSSQALEQMLSSVPRMGQESRAYQTLDVYTSGLSQMYTGPMGPPGGPFGMPGPWQPPQEFGIGGPGEARVVYPGLVERQRFDLDGHGIMGPHINQEYYSPLKDMNKPLINNHLDLNLPKY